MVAQRRTTLVTWNGRNGALVWAGPSAIDGEAIGLFVTGLKGPSANSKTGAMIQTWIMRMDTPPHHAAKTGDDVSICGTCPLRPLLHVKRAGSRPCYVRKYQAPLSVWTAYHADTVADLRSIAKRIRETGQPIRQGSYGDPIAVPAWVWTMLGIERDPRRTGYTHQWKSLDATRSKPRSTMASVHTGAQRALAKHLGYRTFRARRADEPLLEGEIACPASKEAGVLTTCAKCGLCNGSTGPDDKRKDIAIILH